jgi:hypothetical protein
MKFKRTRFRAGYNFLLVQWVIAIALGTIP